MTPPPMPCSILHAVRRSERSCWYWLIPKCGHITPSTPDSWRRSSIFLVATKHPNASYGRRWLNAVRNLPGSYGDSWRQAAVNPGMVVFGARAARVSSRHRVPWCSLIVDAFKGWPLAAPTARSRSTLACCPWCNALNVPLPSSESDRDVGQNCLAVPVDEGTCSQGRPPCSGESERGRGLPWSSLRVPPVSPSTEPASNSSAWPPR